MKYWGAVVATYKTAWLTRLNWFIVTTLEAYNLQGILFVFFRSCPNQTCRRALLFCAQVNCKRQHQSLVYVHKITISLSKALGLDKLWHSLATLGQQQLDTWTHCDDYMNYMFAYFIHVRFKSFACLSHIHCNLSLWTAFVNPYRLFFIERIVKP